MFTKSDSIQSLAAALAQAQAEFPAVPFNAVNPFLKNRYADLGAVIETARPVLAKNGLSFTQMVNSEAEYIGVTTVLMHASGEFLASNVLLPLSEERGKSQAQVAGSVVTYLRRYALASMLGLYADEDNDGQPHQPAPRQTVTQPTQPTQNDTLRVDIHDTDATSVKTINTTDAPPNATTTSGTPTSGNGHKAARPFTPEALKDAITKKAGKHSGATVSDGAKGLMVGQLNALFAGDENKRHQFTKYLTGYGSTKQMPGNVCQSILDWIGSDDEMAKREANAVIAFLDGQNGQGSLLDAA